MNESGTVANATLWSTLEISLSGPTEGNPFLEVNLRCVFRQGEREVSVTGFYDGNGVYKLRFLPDAVGLWTYVTASNVPSLHGLSGALEVSSAKAGCHGPVKVWNRFHFRYSDDARYLNIGTTAYVWNLQGDTLEEQTLATLKDAPFTKIRMCVFPKHVPYNENEPVRYPFRLLKAGKSHWNDQLNCNSGWEFDYDWFEPEYFQHLEMRINQLAEIGIEADLIIFHPYDRWGFSLMTPEQDDRYLRYLTARLSALPNVWWSIANEYDLMPQKSMGDWDRLIGIVADNDPYGHLLSVHNCLPIYDFNDPRITHASIQRNRTEDGLVWRLRYGKPVSFDEVGYEGDVLEGWGNLSAQEMVHRFWKGAVNGSYVTHGETYNNATETIFWAKGGKLIGESVARIAFLRKILEDGPDEGLEPVESTTHYKIVAAGGHDHIDFDTMRKPVSSEAGWDRVPMYFAVAGQPHRYYLSYFGESQPGEIAAVVPPGERYTATLIDTWEMTEREIAADVRRGQRLRFEPKPYQALLLRRALD